MCCNRGRLPKELRLLCAEKKEFFTRIEAPQEPMRPPPWTALLKRGLLRTHHSLVGSLLHGSIIYGLRVYVPALESCAPLRSLWVQLGASVAVSLPLTALYHLLTCSGAGGYYDGYSDQLSNLPQHLNDVSRRNGAEYVGNIENERQWGIFRTVNALESFVICAVVATLSTCLALAHAIHQGAGEAAALEGITSPRWIAAETAAYFALHRLIGANALQGRCCGFLQPEGMHHATFSESSCLGDNIEFKPISRHPEPSY